MTERVFFNENIVKILITVSGILTFIALLSLENTLPITHYELSVYFAAPLFWFFIILSNIILIFCMILQAQNENYKLFWLSFSLLLLNNFIILTQPLMKGYFAYGSSDPWNHYSITKSIVESGTIGNDYYPVTHLLIVELSEILSVNIETIMKLLPAYFSTLYMIFIYFLGNEVFKNKQYAVILAAVSSTFLLTYYQISVYPQGLSIMLLPLVFYLFFRSDAQSINFMIMFILILFLMPFCHPFIEITLIVCLFAAEIIKYVLDRKSINLNKSLISTVLFFAWWSSFAIFATGIKKLNSWIFSEVSSVPRTNEVAFTQHMSIIDTILLFLKSYGSQVIYFSMALIAIILILWRYKKGDKNLNKMIILSGLFIVSLISYYFTFLTQGFTSVGRLLGSNIAVWAVPLLVSFPLFLILKNLNKRKLAFLLIFVIISSSFVISSLGNYRSSWITQPNWDFTYADASTITWEEQNNYMKYRTLHIAFPTSGKIQFKYKSNEFNYYNHTSLTDLFPDNILFVYGKSRQNLIIDNLNLYQSSLLRPWADPDLNNDTMNKIGTDPHVMYIYSNGENDIYLIEGGK